MILKGSFAMAISKGLWDQNCAFLNVSSQSFTHHYSGDCELKSWVESEVRESEGERKRERET